MASISRDILANNKPASHGFFTLLRFICFQPRRFFRILHKTPNVHSIIAACLILAMLSYSAIQQADIGANAAAIEGEDEFLTDEEFSDMAFTNTVDIGQSWMTGMSALGKQMIYWMLLALVLSPVSLFNGKAPRFGLNLQIAVWSSLPFALMAVLQIVFMMGGGSVSKAGFTGFLDTWESYYDLNPYLQSGLYALAAQFTFFGLWNLLLLYKGARESLRGNRLLVLFVLTTWLLMLTLAIGYEHYQTTEPSDFSYDYEEEMQVDEPFYPEMTGEDFP